MTPVLVPLSSVCPCWKMSMIPSAVEALRRGIQRERERFRGKPYVVLATRREFDYDGLTEYVQLLEGFPAESEAVEYAKRSADAARRATLAEPCYGGHRWQVVEEPWSPMLGDRPDREPVRRVFRERFKMANGTAYDSRYFEFDVLHVSGAEIVGPELFAYLGAEYEVTRYLIERGEAHRSASEPGDTPERSDR